MVLTSGLVQLILKNGMKILSGVLAETKPLYKNSGIMNSYTRTHKLGGFSLNFRGIRD